MSNVLVREARIEDASRALDVLRASITRLCVDDHGNDPATLDAWLSNKTEDGFRVLLCNADVHLIVAELGSSLVGVGAIHSSGQIQLCYVHPDFQRRGVGAALLIALERRAARWSLSEITLASTVSACSFYEHYGYTTRGPPQPLWGTVRGFPYAKHLPTTLREPAR